MPGRPKRVRCACPRALRAGRPRWWGGERSLPSVDKSTPWWRSAGRICRRRRAADGARSGPACGPRDLAVLSLGGGRGPLRAGARAAAGGHGGHCGPAAGLRRRTGRSERTGGAPDRRGALQAAGLGRLRRALQARDRGCCFPGLPRSVRPPWAQVAHVVGLGSPRLHAAARRWWWKPQSATWTPWAADGSHCDHRHVVDVVMDHCAAAAARSGHAPRESEALGAVLRSR